MCVRFNKKSLLLQQTEEEAKNWSPLAMSSPEATMDMKCCDFIFLASSYDGRWIVFSVAATPSRLQCRSCDTRVVPTRCYHATADNTVDDRHRTSSSKFQVCLLQPIEITIETA